MATIAEIFNQAKAAFEQGELDPALAMFAKIQPDHGPYYARSLGFIGQILQQKGDDAQAEQYLRSSFRLLHDPDIAYQLGELVFSQRRLPEAESIFRKVVEVDPKYTDAHIRLGMILRERGLLPEAIRAFELAIVNDQRAVVARYFLAQLCIDNGDMKRALSQLHFVLKLQPEYRPARLLMADIFQRLGDHRQALVEFCEVANADQNADASVYWKMARSFQAINDRNQALKAFERAFGLDRSNDAAGWYAAQLREEQGHYERALNLYRMLTRSSDYQQKAQESIERLERMFAQYQLTDRPELATDSADASFEAPPVQAKNVTEPFVQGGGFNTSDLARRNHAVRTAPIKFVPAEPAGPEPTALDGFLRGMMDSVKRHVPTEALDVVKQGLDGLQKIDLDALKRRLGR